MEAIKVHLEVRDWQYGAEERRDNAAAYRQRRIWRSAITATSAVILMAAGFFGYSEMTMAHQFTEGKVDIYLSNEGITYSDGVTRTWVSPTNWAPGDELTASLYISSAGKKDPGTLLADWSVSGSGSPNLLDMVEVAGWYESSDSFSVNRAPLFALLLDSDGDGRLSLQEVADAGPQALGPLPGSGGTIPLEDPYILEMTFRFMSHAGNEYQGTTGTIDLEITGVAGSGSEDDGSEDI